MALIDDIRQIAQTKSSYEPGLANLRSQPIGRQRVEPVKVAEILARTNPTPAPTSVGLQDAAPGSFDEFMARQQAGENTGGDGGFSLKETGGSALKAFGKIIDVVDTPRAAVVSGVKEITDVLPGFEGADGSFDVGDWKQNTADNYGFGDLVEQVMGPEGTDRPLWMRQGLGFVGDLASDPLTYLGFGTVKGVASKGASALDNALAGGGRIDLAQTVVEEAAKRGVASDAAGRLAAEAGQRGRGAFTKKGLARAGVDESLLDDLGLQSRIGYTFGKPGRAAGSINIKGTNKLAEASENLKGSLKARLGKTHSAKVFRRLFSGDTSALGQTERKFIDELITGAPNAATAAAGLASLKLAKAESYSWLDNAVGQLDNNLSGLKKLSDDEASQISDMIEQGLRDGLAGDVSDWYDEVGAFLADQGVDFNWRENYVNHMMTERAWEAVRDGEQRLIVHGLDTKEAFQRTRELLPGDDFLGETLKDGSIRELNEISNRVLGYDVFESDIRELMGAYLSQGQRALMRAKVYEHAEKLGVARQLDEVVDTDRIAREVSEQEEILKAATVKETEALAEANHARKRLLEDAAGEANVSRKKVASELADAEKQLDAAGRKVLRLENRINVSQGKLSAAESALNHWRNVLESAKKSGKKQAAATKGKATRQIKKLEQMLEDGRAEVADLQSQLAKASDPQVKADLQSQVARKSDELVSEQERLQATQLAREAMDDPKLPVPGTKVPAQKVADTNKKVVKVRKKFLNETHAYTDAANAFVWQTIDTDTAVSRLSNVLNQFDKVSEAAQGAKVGNVSHAARKAARDDLRGRVRIVNEAFTELGDEPVLQSIRKTEAQAAAHDMNAWRESVTRAEAQKQIDVLTDPDFQEYMTRVAADGFRAVNDDVQVPVWFDEAMQMEAKMADPEHWSEMHKAIRLYDKGMNVWKGYATASPGFVFRNAYTGFFNMWLDGVAPDNVKKFTSFLRKYHDEGTEKALVWAKGTGRYSDAELVNLEKALEAASASGWGLTPQEVSTQLVGSKATANPLSAEFAPTRAVRSLSSDVEAVMRGAHAFDVLQRGGNVMNAISRVEKFHFNYRDITEFDRAAKRVSPFWTFYSRNMALQAEIWTRFPHKLNRSYFNVKRNLELGNDPDEVVPGYYEEMGAVRTPFGERDGGTWYFTPDLPSLRFRQDLGQLTGTDGDGFSPLRLISDTGPAIKVPVEMAANRKLFTDIPFKNRLYDYTSDGEIEGREPAGLLSGKVPFTDVEIPVVSDVIKNAANLLPGTEIVNGDLLMQDNTQSAIEDFVPLLGRQSRLDPTTDKYSDRRAQSVLSFLGVPVRKNTTQSIRGELYGRQIDAENLSREEQIMEMLKDLP